MTVRVRLHRWRGVQIGKGVFIGTDALIETSWPELVSIGDEVGIGIRATIIAHWHESGQPYRDPSGRTFSVRIEDQASIGPGSIILPNVTIGRGAVVAAGSVVTRSVPAMTLVQGNPAKGVARCGIPLRRDTPIKEFYRRLKPIK
jgi:acetyltransferase-like isoleucine patch superfamily enzyme